jgi:hypothetical protein
VHFEVVQAGGGIRAAVLGSGIAGASFPVRLPVCLLALAAAVAGCFAA